MNAFAQDADFTQCFSNPLFLNPAYSGSLGCSRVAANCRIQWYDMNVNNFISGVSYDQYMPKLHGGLGFRYKYENYHSAIYNNIANISYAYNLNINKNLDIRPALNIGIGQKQIDWSKSSFTPVPEQNPQYYFNAGAGLLIRYKNLITGVSYDHINKPDVLFYYFNSKLPPKLAIHADYRFDINGKAYLTPGIIFLKQQDFEKMVYSLMLKIWQIKLGAGFRQGFINSDCAMFMLGYCNDWMSIGYSYDHTVSKLAIATFGPHEISAVFKFNCKNDKEKYRITQLYGF